MAESKVTAETYEDTCGKDVWKKFQELRGLCRGDTDRELHLLAKLYIAKRLKNGEDFNETYQDEFAMTHGKFILYWRLHSKKWPTDSEGNPEEVTGFDQFKDTDSDDDY